MSVTSGRKHVGGEQRTSPLSLATPRIRSRAGKGCSWSDTGATDCPVPRPRLPAVRLKNQRGGR